MRKATVRRSSIAGAANGGRGASGARATKRRKTVAEINRWMRANYAEVMEAARENCVRLTGKPTLGGVRRRKRIETSDVGMGWRS